MVAGRGDGFVVFGPGVGNSGEWMRVLGFVLGFWGGFRVRGVGFGFRRRVFGNWDWRRVVVMAAVVGGWGGGWEGGEEVVAGK